MNQSTGDNLSPELLNDFYAECEEHLNVVRQSLGLLEREKRPGENIAAIEQLFRSFHSLKGILAIAGLASAEHLAHRTEDYLRDLTRGEVQLSDDGIDLLARVSHSIEQIVSAFREGKALPEAVQVVRQVETLLARRDSAAEPLPEIESESSDPAGAMSPGSAGDAKIDESVNAGFSVWKCVFVPSAALNEKGINVNFVRERLEQYGRIIQASPRIGKGAMAFEFLLAAGSNPAESGEWRKMNVELELVRAASSAGTTVVTPSASINPLVVPSQIVRVEMNRLNDLMRITGDLMVQRARLTDQIQRLESQGIDIGGLEEVNVGFERQFRELRDTVMRLRLVPIAEIFDRLPFVVRDLTRGTARKVRLQVNGQRTELDKFVVEQLKEPLLHLVRNAVSHGIEEESERVRHGKPPEATLSLTAKAVGETVIIEIADDGRGIDREMVLKRAREMGLETDDDLDDSDLLEMICLPGFSTRDEADRAAGRGVGMAVVYNKLRELGGNLALQSEPGKGTRFTLRLPITLLITDALIVSTADQKFAIPQSSVEEVLHFEESAVKRMERVELVSVRGKALPLVRLRRVFGMGPSDRTMPSVLVSETDRGRVGLVVDRILGQRQIVVRPLRDPLIHVAGVIGATELGDGRPLLILDPLTLTRSPGATRNQFEQIGK